MDFDWKVTARQYLKTREELADMDAATFQAYYRKWLPVALRTMSEPVGEKLAKTIGFYDALTDEMAHRTIAPDDPAYYAEDDVARLLDYLYAQKEADSGQDREP